MTGVQTCALPIYAQTAQASDHEPVLTTLAIDTTAVRPVGGLDIESPSAPGNLSATAVTDTTVTLSWTAASDNVAVTGYRIYRDGTLLLTSTAQLFSDSGLQPATSYMYSVTALDASGNESLSSEISITTSTAPVIIPPTTSGGGGSVNVWLLLLLGAVSGLRTVRRQLQPKVPVITLLFKDD